MAVPAHGALSVAQVKAHKDYRTCSHVMVMFGLLGFRVPLGLRAGTAVVWVWFPRFVLRLVEGFGLGLTVSGFGQGFGLSTSESIESILLYYQFSGASAHLERPSYAVHEKPLACAETKGYTEHLWKRTVPRGVGGWGVKQSLKNRGVTNWWPSTSLDLIEGLMFEEE